MAITFKVSRVSRAAIPLKTIPAKDAVSALLGTPVEASAAGGAALIDVQRNAFLDAAYIAFARHYPLILSPDSVWLCIAQGFAAHVNANAESLRTRFVRHEGKKEITVQRDDFIKGSPTNPWHEAIASFSDQIALHIGRKRDLVVCDFSTTGPIERTASEITLMDAMQQYFEYTFATMCGIPEITLLGTLSDWESIRRRAQALSEYDLGWWTDALLPVLDQIVSTASGKVDTSFWQSFFKINNQSGGPYVTGWINVLFPYVKRSTEAPHIQANQTATIWEGEMSKMFGGGPAPDRFPLGISRAPFNWNYLGTIIPMELLSGFVGIEQSPDTLSLRPSIGWAVREANAEPLRRTQGMDFDREKVGRYMHEEDLHQIT